jgi:hypothetical protein
MMTPTEIALCTFAAVAVLAYMVWKAWKVGR